MTNQKNNTLITATVAIIIASAIAQANTALPATGEGGAAPRGLRVSQADASASEQKITFDIDATKLARALIQLTEQSGLQLIYPAGDNVTDLPAKPLKGQYTTEAALKQLLQGTGLQYEFIDAKTISIVDPSAKSLVKTALRRTEGTPNTGTLRLAQNTGEGTRDASTTGLQEEEKGSSESPEGSAGNSSGSLEEVVVTGTNIRGRAEVSAPTITITRHDIENTGFSTVEDLFESIPQNFDGVTPDGRWTSEGGSALSQRNNERATAIDLRGLGPQSTLTLLNGTRRAGTVGGRIVDVSVIPLSAIEKVEVVTGGKSAIYGADAVAGVVNFTTRREFEGAETQVSYGAPTGYSSGDRLQASQIVGRRMQRGGFVAAYDYTRDWASNLADMDMLTSADALSNQTYLTLQPQGDTERHSGFVAGRVDLTDRVELYADGLYSYKDTIGLERRVFVGAPTVSEGTIAARSKQYSFSAGSHVDLGNQWRLNVAGSTSAADVVQTFNDRVDSGSFVSISQQVDSGLSRVTSGSAVADGPLFTVGSVTPRIATGAEIRNESYENKIVTSDVPHPTVFDRDRDVSSLFAEFLLPFVQDGGRPGLRGLEVSLAGRYDDYSDFGGTFNPQAGISWRPSSSLMFRGAYSTAFRAPAVIDLGSAVSAFVLSIPDPTRGGVGAPVLFMQGNNGSLNPEEAVTWTFGFDFEPEFLDNTRLSVSYFSVDYDDRIETPIISAERPLMLQREDRYPGLINRAPTVDDVAEVFALNTAASIYNGSGRPWDPTTQTLLEAIPDLIIADNRTANIATETARGLDLKLTNSVESGIGRLNFGLDATYSLDHERRITATSPAVSLINSLAKPVDFRMRASAGWSRGAMSAFVHVNYVDGYANPVTAPPSTMSSWTTTDLTVRFNGAATAARGWLGGLNATLSVSNLLDKDPPEFVNSIWGVKYDAANANPIGRYVTLRLVQQW